MKSKILSLLSIPVLMLGLAACVPEEPETKEPAVEEPAAPEAHEGTDPTDDEKEYRLPEKNVELTPEDYAYVLDGSLEDIVKIWGLPGATTPTEGAKDANINMLYFSTLHMGDSFRQACLPHLEPELGEMVLEQVEKAELELEEIVGDLHLADITSIWDTPVQLVYENCLE